MKPKCFSDLGSQCFYDLFDRFHLFFIKHYIHCKMKTLGILGQFVLNFISRFSKSLIKLKSRWNFIMEK